MFVTLAGGQLACAIALRARHLRWTSNPLLFGSVALNVGLLLLAVAWQPLRSLLHTAPLRPGDLLGAVLAALAVALVAVVTKRFSTPVATRLATRCL